MLPTRTTSTISCSRPPASFAIICRKATRTTVVRSAPHKAAQILLITSDPKEAWGLRLVSTPRTLPVAMSTICAAMVVVPRSMAIPRPDLPPLDRPELSVRTSICHWPHSSTSGISARAWQASRHPSASSSAVKKERSGPVTGSDPANTRTPHPPQRPVPPHGNSTPNCGSADASEPPRAISTSTDNGSSWIRTLSTLIWLPQWIRPGRLARSRLEVQPESPPHPTFH